MARAADSFDPRAILAALERNYVACMLIGGMARVIRGADELTDGSTSARRCGRRTWSAWSGPVAAPHNHV